MRMAQKLLSNAQDKKKVAIAMPSKVKQQKLDYPAQLKEALTSDDILQDTFKNLTPKQWYGYVKHIISTKKVTLKATRFKDNTVNQSKKTYQYFLEDSIEFIKNRSQMKLVKYKWHFCSQKR